MQDLGSNIGPSSTRRRIATVIALIGVLFVGSLLARVWPRSVEVAFALDPGVTKVDVDYLQEGEAVASARFKPPDESEPRTVPCSRSPPKAMENESAPFCKSKRMATF